MDAESSSESFHCPRHLSPVMATTKRACMSTPCSLCHPEPEPEPEPEDEDEEDSDEDEDGDREGTYWEVISSECECFPIGSIIRCITDDQSKSLEFKGYDKDGDVAEWWVHLSDLKESSETRIRKPRKSLSKEEPSLPDWVSHLRWCGNYLLYDGDNCPMGRNGSFHKMLSISVEAYDAGRSEHHECHGTSPDANGRGATLAVWDSIFQKAGLPYKMSDYASYIMG